MIEQSISTQAYTAGGLNDTLQPCNTLLGSIDQRIGHKKVGQDSDNLGSWVLSKDMDKNSLLYVETILGEDYYWRFSIREDRNSKPHIFDVSKKCTMGMCTCVHYIAGVRAQLKPCRFIAEIFVLGDTDPDWPYIIWGVVFGFHVANPSSEINYIIKFKEIKN